MATYNPKQLEEDIVDFWKKDRTFEKSVEQRPADRPYIFYDGPPFATGLPHYGHILASTIKDVVPRFWTMRGYRVRRRWGWDCHGLPIEALVEEKLGISGKKQIEEKGVAFFNQTCRENVLGYAKEWGKIVERIGRWVEFENSYKTMDSTYMESVWWALKQIWDKGLIYEGRKVLLYCPRCETPISNFEVAMDNSYRNVTEEAVTVKFRVKKGVVASPAVAGRGDSVLSGLLRSARNDVFLLAWTTTPWTLPGNVALAVSPDLDYAVVEQGREYYIIAKERLAHEFGEEGYEIVKELKGKELVGLAYEPLYDIPAIKESGKKSHYVAVADFVTASEGTGIVHTAVVYGEDDYNLGLRLDLPVVPLLDARGFFNEQASEIIAGKYFKDAEKPIKEDLAKRGLIFKKESHTHSYPFCWRCSATLFYNAIPAWFINIQKIKPRLLELNEKINWFPEHLKHWRFKNGIENAPDWNISRNRYWATALPFWKCQECPQIVCVGSLAELKEKAINFKDVYASGKIEEIDLHKPYLDEIKLRCECGGQMRRVPEVVDCWVESASMPFAEFHYPFENREVFQARFPAHFVSEYISQTRAWFYVMHAVATIIFDGPPFLNVVTTGTVLNERGEKMSKSRQNFPDPWTVIEKDGADALRYYLMSSVVMQAENLFFSEREVDEVYKKVILTLWNVFSFFQLYAPATVVASEAKQSREAGIATPRQSGARDYILDRWILAKLHSLIREVTEQFESYNIVRAVRPLGEFIEDLSTWYLRRSRERFKGDDAADRQAALATLSQVLTTLAKLMAPVTPFIAEHIYRAVTGGQESVHLQSWPVYDEKFIDEEVLQKMERVRAIAAAALSIRADNGLKVRQPLSELLVSDLQSVADYLDLLKDELNVLSVNELKEPLSADLVVKEERDFKIALNTVLTDELKIAGSLRELIRRINQLRKNAGLTINDQINLYYETDSSFLKNILVKHQAEIKKNTLSREILFQSDLEATAVEVNGEAIKIKLVKENTLAAK